MGYRSKVIFGVKETYKDKFDKLIDKADRLQDNEKDKYVCDYFKKNVKIVKPKYEKDKYIVFEDDWFEKLNKYVKDYPKAGMIGCLLLYPAKDKEENFFVQHAGGKFNKENNPDHYGSGFHMESGKIFKDVIETDE